MAYLLRAKQALLAVLVINVLLQTYARPSEWTRELQDAEDGEFTSASRGLVQTASCPSAEKYRKTRRGCLCRKGYGTFVFGYDKSSANPDANMYPTIFPSNCRYYVDGTDTSMNFPTNKGRCFCFTCPTFSGVKYVSPGVGFLNGYSSGCYPYRYFFGRILIQGTTCSALTANAAQYAQVQTIITAAFRARFNTFNNTFAPVVNQFTCTDGPNGAYLGFRLGYLGPFIDAQNGIISDILTNICQRTTLCNNLNPQLPGGATTNPIGQAGPNPLPPVSSSSPAPSSNPPASQICTTIALPTGGNKCANLIAQNKNCQETNILNPLDALNLPLLTPILGSLGILGNTLNLANLNSITEQVCVGILCPTLALGNPGYALYAPSTLGLPVGGLRCKCYGLLSTGTCTQVPGDYNVYQYQGGNTPAPTPGPLGPITGLLPIGSLTSILQSGGDCAEAPVAIPPASLSLLGLNVISSLDQCINACNLVTGRTYASYSSVLGTNLLPTCKCFTAANCTPQTCGLLGLNCLLSSYTIYKFT